MISWISMPVIPPGVPVTLSTRVIGHDLPAGTFIPAGAQGVRVPAERRVHGDAGRDGEQGGQVAHGVRCRAEADVPFGGGVGRALGDGARVPAVGGGPGRGHDGPVSCTGQRSGVGGEFLIDAGPVRGGQGRRFAHQQRGPPLVQLPRLHGSERVRHLRHQGLGQAQQPVSLGRGFATREGDLRSDACPEPVSGDPGVRLLPALQLFKGDGQAGLAGSQGRLFHFQCPDLINQPGTILIGHTSGQG